MCSLNRDNISSAMSSDVNELEYSDDELSRDNLLNNFYGFNIRGGLTLFILRIII
jgi:hypothetical protein